MIIALFLIRTDETDWLSVETLEFSVYGNHREKEKLFMKVEIEIDVNAGISCTDKISLLVGEIERLNKKLIRRGMELDLLYGEIKRLKEDNAVLREQVEFYECESDSVEEEIETYMGGNILAILEVY